MPFHATRRAQGWAYTLCAPLSRHMAGAFGPKTHLNKAARSALHSLSRKIVDKCYNSPIRILEATKVNLMARPASTSITCPSCSRPFGAILEQLLDVGRDPTAKERLLSGRVNLITC